MTENEKIQIALGVLKSAYDDLENISKTNRDTHEYHIWYNSISDALAQIFDTSHKKYQQFNDLYMYPSFTFTTDFDAYAFNYGMKRMAAFLESTISFIETYMPPTTTSVECNPIEKVFGEKIFIVCGRDKHFLGDVERTLNKFGLHTIILSDVANTGDTIIEKFEKQASECGFAIILLSPDDEGALKGDPLQPRARQNVILEWGYFTGYLSRERTCALCRGEVEFPSDMHGLVYTNWGEDTGKLQLARDLRAAGFEIDANTLI